MGLIALLSGLLAAGLPSFGARAALASGQSTLMTLVTAARARAMASGRKTRLLVAENPGAPDHYLRRLIMQQGRQVGPSPADWDTVHETTLPDGIFVVPASLAGLVDDAANWKKASDPAEDLVSAVLLDQRIPILSAGDPSPQPWSGVAFTPNGTLASVGGGPPPRGTIVLAAGRFRSGAMPGQPPIELVEPERVRGIFLSAYGVPALLNGRQSF